MQSLPDKVTTLDTMVITRLLSAPATKTLGEPEFQYIFESQALQLEKGSVEDHRNYSLFQIACLIQLLLIDG